MTTPKISVIIVNYNSGSRLEKCLSHLAKQTATDFETIVIDNASNDGSADCVNQDARTSLIRAGGNLGFAAANNLAVQSARGLWLAFLNPDAYAEPDWLASFEAAIQRHPDVDAFGSLQIDDRCPERLDGAGDVCHAFGLYYRGAFGWPIERAPRDGYVFSPSAAAAFYRRSTFETLGGFDERFFCYGEDVDLGFRLRLAGGRAIQLADAKVRHEGSGVTGRRSDFSIYHGVRNRIWLFYKNLPFAAYFGLAPVHFLINLAMLGRSVVGGEGGAYWRGMRDGYGGLKSLRQSREAVQRARTLSVNQVLRALTWSLRGLFARAPDLRER